ncbi:MAG: hypothetical protein Tsb009_36850 [Planctomycetaceae bacterium]
MNALATRPRFFSVIVIIAALHFLGRSHAGEDIRTTQKKSPNAAEIQAQKEVHAAMRDAIRTWESGKFREFLEYYAPVEELQRIRRGEDGGTAGLAKRIAQIKKEDPKRFLEMTKSVVEKMKKSLKLKAKFDPSYHIAKFHIVYQPEEILSVKQLTLFKVVNPVVNATGYGLDLKNTIKAAQKDLQNGNVLSYLKKMLPISELQQNDVAKLAARMKASPKSISTALNDLKAMQALVEKTDIKQNVAVFKIPRPPLIVDDFNGQKHKIEIGPKIIKLEKVGKHWRFFDNTIRLQKNLGTLQQNVPAYKTIFIMEKFKDHWRLSTVE